MADNTPLSAPVGSGDTIRDKDRAGVKTQIVGLDLTPAGGSETLMNGSIPVTDNGGSLTVDAPVGTPVFVRLSDGSSAIATLPVSVASLPGQAADNAAALPGALYVVAGWDGTNVQALSTDSSGLLQVDVATAPTTAVTGPLTDAQLRAVAVPVSGTVTANLAAGTNNIGDVDVLTLPSIPAGNNNIGDVDVASLPSIPAGNNNIGDVDIASALPAGTNNIGDVDVLTLPGVAGTIAHDSADSGNPVKTGARALTSDITAVAANDRVDTIASSLAKQVYLPYALPGQLINGALATALTNTTAADVIAAPGAGIRLYITEITVTNNHATVITKVEIRDGTTVKKVISCAALGGGASITLPAPLRLTANTALTARCVTTGADVDVSATGYTAAE